MREARLILPNPNSPFGDKSTDDVLIHVVAAFGGYTSAEAQGAWRGYKQPHVEYESVMVVDVAYEPNDEADSKLFDIANAFRIDAKQEAVYLRYGNGHVQMVKDGSAMDNGHCNFDPSFGGVLEAINVLSNRGLPLQERVEAFEYLEETVAK